MVVGADGGFWIFCIEATLLEMYDVEIMLNL